MAPFEAQRFLTIRRRFAAAVVQQVQSIFLLSFVAVLVGTAWQLKHEPWTVSVTLVRPMAAPADARESHGLAGHSQDADEVLANMLRSEASLSNVVQRAGGGVGLGEGQPVFSTRSGLRTFTLSVQAGNRAAAVVLANAFAAEAVALSGDLATSETRRNQKVLQGRLVEIDRELEAANAEMIAASARSVEGNAGTGLTNILREISELDRRCGEEAARVLSLSNQVAGISKKILQYSPALVSAREALDRELMRFKEEHPRVKELTAGLRALEADLETRGSVTNLDVSSWANPAASALYAQLIETQRKREEAANTLGQLSARRTTLAAALPELPAQETRWVQLLSRTRALQEARFALAAQEQMAALPSAVNAGAYHLLRPVSPSDVYGVGRWGRALAWGGLCGLLAAFLGCCAVGLVELQRQSIESPTDLADATGLPVLAVLGDLQRMSPAEQEDWAYRTFSSLKAHLSQDQRDPLICGFMAARPGEGCSTWVKLLAGAARRQGFRVLTVEAPAPAPVDAGSSHHLIRAEAADLLPILPGAGGLVPSTGPTHLQLPAWEWNIAQCAQWRSALAKCHSAEHLVVLTRLPPACVKESIMLAQEMPNLLWLGARAMAESREIQTHVALLRGARCRLAGAVLNRHAQSTHPSSPWAGPVTALLLTLLIATSGLAQNANSASVATNGLASAGKLGSSSAPSQLAPWQTRLTLGPGDVLDISLYGAPDSMKAGLIVGPDGRLSYLEARDILASGLTVDELRQKIETELGKVRRSPSVMVNPESFRSKKYFVLGNVVQKGAYVLDRPVTLLEAVARAKGFVTTMEARNAMVQADLERAFLVRRNENGTYGPLPVDFEALFQKGDLTQNVSLYPDDYLFFPPLGIQEVYVLGEVKQPGTVPLSGDMTVEGAIVARGGFGERAWKSRVLVIHGSLNQPEGAIVNVRDAVKGKVPGTLLKNKDIVYVSERPFARVEEMLDYALQSFTYSFVIGTQGRFVPALFTQPIIK